ncbi:helix-turn-helix transcriptional regulator [Bacillus sp. AGMB 02131]|uniref:Helix-turn-helix transcriptional regulator n=1 Tax=Peribacillus faecalis TaxID=2772559 RepID=A0A927HAL6_9BACI|nr:autorepressor SdpR family transcription factor [Peribacillus faecalis]MBD3108815.1 helix-turn-helix transcriptional regulator [Peribacillus faecalis]
MNNVFKALNDSTRREILSLLSNGNPLTVNEIHTQFNISMPSISHHLTILKNAELVKSVKKGQYVYYTIHTTVIQDVMKWLVSLNFKEGHL